MTDATRATGITPAFVIVEWKDDDGNISEHIAAVEITRDTRIIATVKRPRTGGVWRIADWDPRVGAWSTHVFRCSLLGAAQRTAREELEHRWPDATTGMIRIAETLLADGWPLSLEDLRAAAETLDDAGDDQ